MIKMLTSALVAAVVALSLVHGAAASATHQTATPAPTPAPAFPASHKNILMYVDTVLGSGSTPPGPGCAQTNLFRRGQTVVFRMWGNNAKLGGQILTPKIVASAELVIPGQATPTKLTYGNHGAVAFWVAPWFTKSDTPLGVVDFTVVVKTKTVKYQGKKVKGVTGTFTQRGLAEPSRLTITP